ncbi:hypothetical protein CSC64_07715 [Pseudoxanthomonas koreensis]|nr:hypothetical protein CSC64_07715 [Pseudoxanthomonas koreensis]
MGSAGAAAGGDSGKRSSARHWLAWVLVALALAAGIGMRAPSPPDEPRFVLAAKAMEASGQWLLPHRGIELYAEKPPVFMWLQALSHRLLGDWNLAFLLPSLLAGLLCLWLTHDLGRRLWGRKVARHAALALFCTLQFGLMAKRAQIDMVLVAMTTLALWALCRHLLRGPSLPCLALAGFAAGLGTVTKGVGFLPLLVLLPWVVLRWRRKAPVVAGAPLGWAWLPTGFLAGVGIWLVPLGLALLRPHGAELDVYARDILLRQTGTRYVAAWHHVQPAWYYLQVILTLWLPGSLLLPRLVPAWYRRLRRWDPRQVLLLGWAALVLVFFSATPGKREVYILPALPALCVAAAPLLPGLLRMAWARRCLRAYAIVLAIAALATGAILMFEPGLFRASLSGRDLDPGAVHALATWLLVLGVALVLVAGIFRAHPGRATVAATVLLWTVYGIGLMPTLDPFASSARLMQKVEERMAPGDALGMVDWREQNYLQARRAPVDFGFKAPVDTQWQRAFAWLGEWPRQRWVLASRQSLHACLDRDQVLEVGQSNRNTWLLVPGTAMTGDCAVPVAREPMPVP